MYPLYVTYSSRFCCIRRGWWSCCGSIAYLKHQHSWAIDLHVHVTFRETYSFYSWRYRSLKALFKAQFIKLHCNICDQLVNRLFTLIEKSIESFWIEYFWCLAWKRLRFTVSHAQVDRLKWPPDQTVCVIYKFKLNLVLSPITRARVYYIHVVSVVYLAWSSGSWSTPSVLEHRKAILVCRWKNYANPSKQASQNIYVIYAF